MDRAPADLPKWAYPVHHSDRGCPYCSHRYVEKLQVHGLGCSFRNKKQALEAIDEMVFLYNSKRPHLSLNYETPEKMHRRVA
ncbi:MAG: integrase core domain-containing protein [Spirochaetaceae bacterium]|nr:integrase core domain-containing protein [Spirochaetaceae bacterium]